MPKTQSNTNPQFTTAVDHATYDQRHLEVLDFAEEHNGHVSLSDADNKYLVAVVANVNVPTYDEVTDESGDADETRVIFHTVPTLKGESSAVVLSEREGIAIRDFLNRVYPQA